MENEKSAEELAATAAAQEAEAKAKAEAEAKANLHKKTELEKASYSLKKNAERLKELGGDPNSILGIKHETLDEEDEDNQPLTMGKLKELQRKEAQKTALTLADSIEDELERREVKSLLESRITPSGNPEADLALARGAANARKNALLAEELARKGQVNRTAPGGNIPGKAVDTFEPTPQEKVFMGPPYNLTQKQILEARKGKA